MDIVPWWIPSKHLPRFNGEKWGMKWHTKKSTYVCAVLRYCKRTVEFLNSFQKSQIVKENMSPNENATKTVEVVNDRATKTVEVVNDRAINNSNLCFGRDLEVLTWRQRQLTIPTKGAQVSKAQTKNIFSLFEFQRQPVSFNLLSQFLHLGYYKQLITSPIHFSPPAHSFFTSQLHYLFHHHIASPAQPVRRGTSLQREDYTPRNSLRQTIDTKHISQQSPIP